MFKEMGGKVAYQWCLSLVCDEILHFLLIVRTMSLKTLLFLTSITFTYICTDLLKDICVTRDVGYCHLLLLFVSIHSKPEAIKL